MAAEVKCWCQHCGKELPRDHKGPCPYCGKTGRHFIVTAKVSIGLAVSSSVKSVKKARKYTKKHPRLTAASIALTIASPIVGYPLGDALVALLIGIILAILNLWLTPHVKETIKETIAEITPWGDKGIGMQEAEVENNRQQKKAIRIKDIYRKLEGIENRIDSSSRTQKFAFLYALGAAFVILGLSYWPGLLQQLGIDTARFYLINPMAFIVLGFIAIIYARVFQRAKKKKLK